MAFENSPKMDSPEHQKPSSLTDWLTMNRRKAYLFLLIVLVIWLLIAAMIIFTKPASNAGQYGGLDGTVISLSGEPLSSQVIINDKVAQTYDDGYFFFSDLMPGRYIMKITADSGYLEQEVDIISGQVNTLGTIILK